MENLTDLMKGVRAKVEDALKERLMTFENQEYDFGNVKVAYNKKSPSFVRLAKKVKLNQCGVVVVYYIDGNYDEGMETISNVLYTEQVLEMIKMIDL